MKRIIRIGVMCGLVSGAVFAADMQKKPQSSTIRQRISREGAVWKQGLAAAKKRHIQRQKLNQQEVRAYNAVLKRVGGLTALLAAIGAGVTYEVKRRAEAERTAGRAAEARKAAEIKDVVSSVALYRAVETGDLKEVKRLSKEPGIMFELDGRDGKKVALVSAARNGHLDVVKALLEAGANINAVGEYSETALISAARNGHLDVVQELLKHKDIALDRNSFYGPALVLAAGGGYLDVVKALLDAGANIDVKNDSKQTALMAAARGLKKEVVGELLKRGANRDIEGEFGLTAERVARDQGYIAKPEEYNAIADMIRDYVPVGRFIEAARQ